MDKAMVAPHCPGSAPPYQASYNPRIPTSNLSCTHPSCINCYTIQMIPTRKSTSSNLPTLQKLTSPKKPRTLLPNNAPLPRAPALPCRKRMVAVACANQTKHQSPPGAAQIQAPRHTYKVEFETLDGCRLGISRYPDFEYNAKGESGTGVGTKDGTTNRVLVNFDVNSLDIPALSGATTKFLGLPLPPFLRIEVLPEVLQGSIDKTSGEVELLFRSKFCFSVGSIYRAPPLYVETTLTSEESNGTLRRGNGERMDGKGRCRLVGVAVVDPVDDALMNTFLGLPTECIAYLNATISITSC